MESILDIMNPTGLQGFILATHSSGYNMIF